LAQPKVLVVDDEPVFLDAICRTLARHGYDVLRANGPHQALEIVRNPASIDAVLSDIQMPEMLGPDLVRELAQIIPETACILMTGGGLDSAHVVQNVPLLQKPIFNSDLIAAVQHAIARSEELRAKLRKSTACADLRRDASRPQSQCLRTGRKIAETTKKSRFGKKTTQEQRPPL
jgi:CheY-like chemotaxis protein